MGRRTNRHEIDALLDVLTFLWSAHAKRHPDHEDQQPILSCIIWISFLFTCCVLVLRRFSVPGSLVPGPGSSSHTHSQFDVFYFSGVHKKNTYLISEIRQRIWCKTWFFDHLDNDPLIRKVTVEIHENNVEFNQPVLHTQANENKGSLFPWHPLIRPTTREVEEALRNIVPDAPEPEDGSVNHRKRKHSAWRDVRVKNVVQCCRLRVSPGLIWRKCDVHFVASLCVLVSGGRRWKLIGYRFELWFPLRLWSVSESEIRHANQNSGILNS